MPPFFLFLKKSLNEALQAAWEFNKLIAFLVIWIQGMQCIALYVTNDWETFLMSLLPYTWRKTLDVRRLFSEACEEVFS